MVGRPVGAGPGDGRLLIVNAGSSSLKLRVLGAGDRSLDGRLVESWDGQDVRPIAELLEEKGPVTAVAHRVVHGGDQTSAVLLTSEMIERLAELTPLAPLHQGRSLAGIAAARTAAPDVEHVACFDTAHHTTLPPAAATYALPAPWRERWPLRRYGFHGLSHAYAARRAGEILGAGGTSGGLRVVSCHLGAGASLCAARAGWSVDTTMGFTPLEGLVMATRSGTVDPGLVLWLITEAGIDPADVQDGMEHWSGLQGLAGTPDMAEVVERRRAGDGAATLAFDTYVHAVRRHAGAMVASAGGLDALVFTAGVGERSPEVRAAVAEGLAHLGVALDPVANGDATGAEDRHVGAAGAVVPSLVVVAREDLEMARQTRALLAV